jgi:cyclophilin family peptidyl-prolyl cis-trans isomerase
MKRLLPFAALMLAAVASLPGAGNADLPNGLYAVFTTSRGVFTAKLDEKYTPIAVANFVGLATGSRGWLDPKTKTMVKRPMYDNITFHRVIRDEMIQSGDPTGTSAHNCGFTIRDEFLPGLMFNRPGRLAVANSGAQDSGACQFFITVAAVPRWNNMYTIFGDVVSGLPVVMEINHEKVEGDKPVDPVRLITVRILRVGPPPPVKASKNKSRK